MTFESVVSWLDDILECKANVKETTECLREIEELVVKVGLEKLLLDELWRKIMLLSRQHLMVQGIFSMHPRDVVLPDTIDFLLTWVVDAVRSEKQPLVARTMLQWLIAAVHYRVIAAKELQHSYYLILSLLSTPGYANEICHLLYYLTEPHLVTPYTAKCLMSVKFQKKNYCHAAVLSLYNRLKPHLIENAISYENDLEILPVLPRKILDCFTIARTNRNLSTSKKNCRYPNWRLQTIAYTKYKLGAIRYVSEMTLPEAIQEATSSEIYIRGTVFDSFLMNPYGFIFFAFADRQIHEWMETYIEKELEANQALLSRKEKENFVIFLRNVARLQNINGECIRPVNRFLKENMATWNGVLYIKEIFGLLNHVVVSDYNEFFESILKPLYKLNVKFRDKDFSKRTIRSLAQCFMNNTNDLQKTEQIFRSSNRPRCNRGALQHFEKSFRYLCTLFVNGFDKNASILHEIVDNCVVLSLTIKEDDYQQHLLPHGIVHKIVINSDFMLVNKLCWILKTHIINEQKTGKCRDGLPLEPLRGQLSDVMNIFFKNILFTKIFDGCEEFHAIDKQIAQIGNIRRYFRSRNSFIFMPLVRIDNDNVYHTNFNRDLYIDMIREYCECFGSLTNIT